MPANDRIRTVSLLLEITNLVENPQAIQVQTIKKKYLDQMPKVNYTRLADMEIIGRTDVYVIFRRTDGVLCLMHWTDFTEKVRYKLHENGMDHQTAADRAYRSWEILTQTFAD